MNSDEAVIHVEHLTYNHGADPEPALNDITIICPKGSRTVLVGANGGTVIHRTTGLRNPMMTNPF
jgi:ABC-type Mn2+/Zn2+ transport system ATPase subunit